MNKTDDKGIFQKYLQKKAIDLYEYHLLMLHNWRYLCLVPRNLLLLPRELIEVKTLPLELPKKARASIKQEADQRFKKAYQKNSLKKARLDEVDKKLAFTFLLEYTKNGPRKAISREDLNSFGLCSLECRWLSIIYKNFWTFQKKLHLDAVKLFLNIDHLKDQVWLDCNALFDYWNIKNKRLKASSEGGGADKYLKGIYLAIEQVLKDRPKASAAFLWKHFNSKHTGEENALPVNGYNVYCYDNSTGEITDNLIYQDNENEKPKSIKYEAFDKYVTKAKQALALQDFKEFYNMDSTLQEISDT